MKLAILDDYPEVSKSLVDWSELGPAWDVHAFDRHLSADEAIAELASFDALIVMRERMALPANVLTLLPILRYIGVIGTSARAIDLEAASALGIVVTLTGANPAGLASTVELTWGLILAAARRIPQEYCHLRAGIWQTNLGITLRGKTLGILGLGRVGADVAAIARAFGMTVVAWSENLSSERAAGLGAELVSKDELLKRSDVLSIHLQLGERSVSTLSKREFAMMQPDAILINTARSAIVNQAAMLAALKEGTIGFAALDVFDQEPLPTGHALMDLKNVILTPHLGYSSVENHQTGYRESLDNLLAYVSGELFEKFPARVNYLAS